jgi:hypothetical protein
MNEELLAASALIVQSGALLVSIPLYSYMPKNYRDPVFQLIPDPEPDSTLKLGLVKHVCNKRRTRPFLVQIFKMIQIYFFKKSDADLQRSFIIPD